MTARPIIFVPPLLLVLFLAFTWPAWHWLWREWWHNDYYSHGLLVVPVASYLAWRRLFGNKEQTHAFQEDSRGLLLLAGSLLLFLYFLKGSALYLAALTIVGILGGLLWTFGGIHTLRLLAFPLGYLALMVPLPFIERTTLPLALWTGLCSGTIVQWLGVDVLVQGAAVTLPNANLAIGAQCSGISSIIALIALTTLIAYAVRGSIWRRLALVVLALPLALLGNILRVANLIVVARYFGVQAGFTFYHDYSGPIFFILVLLLLFPLMRILRCNDLRLELL